MAMNIYTIQDLRDGKVAVLNDGSIEQLRAVIHFAWPEGQPISGGCTFYKKDEKEFFTGTHATSLPIQSVKIFCDQLPDNINHYSANPEVTTTLDPVTEYQTKSPKGEWSVDFKEETNCEKVTEATQRYADNLKEKHRMQGVISELNYLIKVQKKALKQAKKLRDKLNAETNY